jgi:hypothetical protein
MDTEARDLLIRIDERTKGMAEDMAVLKNDFGKHEDRDHKDFQETFTRLGKIERKAAWFGGAGAAFAFMVSTAVALVKGWV